ncbi:hypothetical protein ABH897_003660 [Paenibacillus sp. RC73]
MCDVIEEAGVLLNQLNYYFRIIQTQIATSKPKMALLDIEA